MLESDPAGLRADAVSVGLDQLPDGSLAAASRFSEGTQTLFSATRVDGGTRPSLKAAAEQLDDFGGTDYQSAFLGAQDLLLGFGSADKRALIFLSDGVPNSTDFDADRPIGAAGTPIYTIGFGTADQSILAEIAAGSGGQAFSAGSAGELQSIFARIVAALTCDAQALTDSFWLAPGESRSIPFAVGPDDGEFRALAAWSEGDVTVTASRPDASVMSPGSLLGGETFVSQSSYALLSGSAPASGAWALNLTADSGNVDDVSVTIDVWKRRLVQAHPTPPVAPVPPAKPAAHAVKGRHADPCITRYPGYGTTTKKVFGGKQTIYDRTTSLYLVCTGFGAPQDLQLTPAMQCALIAAAATYGGPAASRGASWACDTVEIAEALESKDWLGAVAGKACGYFGDVFATGVGIFTAGATAETGPGAAAIGLNTYRALAAGMKVACGGLFDGGAASLGAKWEADHETHVALDVTRNGRCIAFKQAFGLVSFSAPRCP